MNVNLENPKLYPLILQAHSAARCLRKIEPTITVPMVMIRLKAANSPTWPLSHSSQIVTATTWEPGE